jgi:two-component system sensor histidine kinase BaeS
MFRSLRARLIFSHILPVIIVVPLMYIAMVYLLETQLLMPQLAENLRGNARILTEMSRTETITTGNVDGIEFAMRQVQINPNMRVIYMEPDGTLVYTNDPSYAHRMQQQLDVPSLTRLQKGDEVVITNYSFMQRSDDFVQVLQPVSGSGSELAGILWMTYYSAAVENLFKDLRLLSLAVVVGFLLLGSLMGSMLALSISNPVSQVTQAIQGLARGESSTQLDETGPREIRALVHSVNYLVKRLEDLETARRQLLANLVHELGRPLGALRSGIQALGRGAAQDPELMDELASGMDEETARLQKVLDELAHLHDQVLGPLELKLEETQLSEWLPRVLIPWGEAATDKRLAWKTDIPDDLPSVQIDRMRFSQVVGNLASNAVKYTPSGRSVEVTAVTQGEDIWIRFKDNGPGIAPEEQEQIFAPFYRGDQGRRIKQGMGLGLSIARDLTAAHGGHLELESTPGLGSSFTIWLPIHQG